MPEPLRVEGPCRKCGHVVKTTALAGRATWRGKCPQDGCDGTVIARRPKATAAPQGTPDAPTGPAGRRTRRRVPRVEGYATPSADRGTSRVPDPQPSDPEPGPDQPGPDPEPGPDPGEPDAGGWWQRVRRRRAAARSADPETGPRSPWEHLGY